MPVLKALRTRARYNILTPVLALSAVATHALAGEVTSPTSNYVITAGDNSLTNYSTITGNPAVSSSVAVDTIDNTSSGTISGGTGKGIYINNTLGTLTNAGTISSTNTYGVEVIGDVGTINNSGTITTGANYGVYVRQNLNVLNNSGTIFSSNSTGFYVGGTIGTFSNSGTIKSDSETGVWISGDATSFDNSGIISGSNYGAFIDDVGTFTNSGSIIATAGTALEVDGDVTTLSNSGTIEVTAGGQGVFITGNVTDTFANSGTITSATSAAVSIVGTVHSFANTGTINFGTTGVIFRKSADSFTNSGTISGGTETGVSFAEGVGTFSNSGTISGGFRGVYITGDDVTGFTNSGMISSSTNDNVLVTSNIGTFTNSGTIAADDGHGVDLRGTVGTFFNSGTITGQGTSKDGVRIGDNVGTFTNSGTITGLRSGVYVWNGGVTTFANSGTISATNYVAVNVDGAVDEFSNTGTIQGRTGAYLGNDAGIFANSGTISATNYVAAYVSGSVDEFSNTGTIQGRTGVYVGGLTGSFSNSGSIVATTSFGVSFNGDVGSFANSGTISSMSKQGAYFNGAVGSFANSGTISGNTGVEFNKAGSAVTLSNSGAIVGTGGTAIKFNSGDDTLTLQPGGTFSGIVDFGDGANTFDFSAYSGNMTFGYATTGTLTDLPGSNLYYDNGTDTVYIVGASQFQLAPLPVTDIVGGVSGLIPRQMDGPGDAGSDGFQVLGYAESPASSPAASAIDDATVTPPNPTLWAAATGGGGWTPVGPGASDVYGALVAGAHTTLGSGLTVGVLGGYARSHWAIGSDRTVDANVGLLGVYGQQTLDAVALDFNLLAGVSSNAGTRRITTQPGAVTNTASYMGWFVAPSIGARMGLAEFQNGSNFGVTGRLGYVAGAFQGYTESGPGSVLTVGTQGFSVFTASLALDGEVQVAQTEAGAVKATGSLGAFAQSNIGVSAVPISLQETVGGASFALGSVTSPANTVYGAKLDLGIELPLTPTAEFSGGITGRIGSDGSYGGAARVRITGNF